MKEAIVILAVVMGIVGSLISISASGNGWGMRLAFSATFSALAVINIYILVTSFGKGGVGWALIAIGVIFMIVVLSFRASDEPYD